MERIEINKANDGSGFGFEAGFFAEENEDAYAAQEKWARIQAIKDSYAELEH